MSRAARFPGSRAAGFPVPPPPRNERRCPAAPQRAPWARAQARRDARREAFRAVARLQRAFPGDERAVAYQGALAPLVDAAAQSPEAADSAYFALEALRDAVGRPPWRTNNQLLTLPSGSGMTGRSCHAATRCPL